MARSGCNATSCQLSRPVRDETDKPVKRCRTVRKIGLERVRLREKDGNVMGIHLSRLRTVEICSGGDDKVEICKGTDLQFFPNFLKKILHFGTNLDEDNRIESVPDTCQFSI